METGLGVFFSACLCGMLWMIAWVPLSDPGSFAVYLWNGEVRLLTFLLISEVSFRLRVQQENLTAAKVRLQELLEREKEMFRHDSLTGALNSRGFLSRLSEERGRSRRYGRGFSLLYLDLDGFKELNDAHGHSFGDTILNEMAHVVLASLQDVDSLARPGGDEFAVLMAETSPEGARRCALLLRCSIGCASFQPSRLPESPEACVRIADEAMYQAKRAGKDRIQSAS